jgi:hypothetical protein
MQVFVFHYKGEYCYGGYVCVSNSIEDAKKLLARTLQELSDMHLKLSIDNIIRDLFKPSIAFLEFVMSVPTSITNEMILLNSFDMC